jgi:hypothetical protein
LNQRRNFLPGIKKRPGSGQSRLIDNTKPILTNKADRAK